VTNIFYDLLLIIFTAIEIPSKSPAIESSEKESPKASLKNNLVGQLIITKPKFETKMPKKNIFNKFPTFISLNSLLRFEEINEPVNMPRVVIIGRLITAPTDSNSYENIFILSQLNIIY